MKSALIALAFATMALTASSSAQAPLAGEWQGTLDANGTTFHLAWHAVASKEGTLSSTFDNIDEGVYGIKVKSMTLKGSDLTMSVEDTVQINGQATPIKGDFVGVISPDGNEVTGTWTQTDPEQPSAQIHFKRAAAQTAPAPPATVSKTDGD